MTDYQKRRMVLVRAVRRLVRAQEAYAFRGAGYPEDIPAIEQELKDAEQAFQYQLNVTLEPWRET